MFIKKAVCASILILVALSIESGLCSTPGQRPDKNPWYGSVSDKIVDQYEDLYELKSKKDEKIEKLVEKRNKEIAKLTKKRSEAPNWAIVRKSKSNYDDLIDETKQEYAKKIAEKQKEYNIKIIGLKDEIVDTMASPATADLKKKKEAVSKIQRLSEMYETYNAIINVRAVAISLNSDLRLNLSDYELASKTYAVQLELLSMVIHINDLFIDRLNSYYTPKLKKRIENNEIAMLKNIQGMKSDKDISEDFVKRQNNRLRLISKSLGKALDNVEIIKKKALQNRKMLITQHNKTKMIKRGSDSAKESSSYVAQINEDFETIQIDIPDPVEFEFIESDLEIAKVK